MKFKKTLSILLALCMVLSLLPVVALAVEITGWAELQAAFSAGGSVVLQQDVTAVASDSALTVPSGKNVTLDLNGYTIDRGLSSSEAKTNGNVITNNGTLTITDSSTEKTGIITGGNNTGSGGCIVNAGTLTVSGGTLGGNSAREAGAVLNQFGARLTIRGGKVLNNRAVTYGGGAIVNHSTFIMSGGTVQNNTAAMNGGGVWSDGPLTVTNGSISNNTAQQNGGAVYINTGGNEISGGSISGNTASSSGGAVYICDGTTTISGGTFDDNTASAHGGAIYVYGDETVLNLVGGTITGNTAGQQGGAILKYQDKNRVNIKGSPVIMDNHAATGPDIYMRNNTGRLYVTGKLGADARIGVTHAKGVETVTFNFGEYNGDERLACFIPGDSASAVYTLPVGVLGISEVVTAPAGSDPVDYTKRSWDDVNKKVVSTREICVGYELLHSSNSSWYTVGQEGKTTWYVARGNITMNGTTLTVRGNVNIILCDGADVWIKDGVEVKTGYSLSIYGQYGSTGKLVAVNNEGDAGIGCGPNSGVGDITIHGGKIEADGGKYAAGIGSGEERQMGSHITIYGGDIKAFGGEYGAGIGSGDESGGDNGYIDIYGGTVYAEGGFEAAGIGGGNEGNGRNITIWGGDVTAISGNNANSGAKQSAGIGGGDDGGGGTITINGGNVYAKGSSLGPGIGGDTNCGTIVINGGTVKAESKFGAGIGGAMDENLVKGSITINGGTVTAKCLSDTGYGSAGIGAGGRSNGGFLNLQYGSLKVPITINGGTVTARGSGGGAGIGAGQSGNVTGQITITGGYVDADSCGEGAGIGSGEEVAGSGGEVETVIKITGGTVIAHSNSALAIGHGEDGSDKGAELYYDAKVTAGGSKEEATLQTTDNRAYGLTRRYAKIEQCEHADFLFFYSDDYFHARQCKYCVYGKLEPHSDESNCVCGYHNPIRTVVLNSLEGIETLHIHEDTYYKLPFREGQIITDGNGNYMRVSGWQKSGDPSAHVSAPGVLFLVEEDISLDAVGDKIYGISFAETQNGSISTEQTVGDLTGAGAGETVSLDVKPDRGYSIGKVSYTVCAGENPLLDPVTLQPVEVEIPLTDGEYRFVMPNVSDISGLANTLLISAEFDGIPVHTISCAPCTNGTISTDEMTSAYEGEIVRVYVQENEGYEASGVYVNGTKIEPSEDGNYFFTMPTEDVTLTAVFTPVVYEITYELNGGDNNSDNPETYTVENEPIPLADPTREGFDFLGWYDDEFFKNDVVTEIAQGSTGDLTLYAKWQEQEYVSDWTQLQNEINDAAEDAVITLTQDYDAEQNDAALTIRDGKKLTVDLNGHTLNANGNAIRIFEIQNGNLTVTDSAIAGGGTITGGNVGSSVGGAVIVRAGGTFTLNGGTITNCAASNGGAVALTAATSLFTMNGGTISYNSATHGGGVHVQQGKFVMNAGAVQNNGASENGGGLDATQNADITLAGGRIEQNTAEKGNVYLNNVGMKVSGDLYIESVYLTDPILSVVGELADTAVIGLTYSNNAANNGKTLTSGLNGNGTLENFISAKNGYLTGLNPDGEIVLGTPVTVSFDVDGGSEVESQTIAKNSVAAEPAAPTYAGYAFKGWYLDGEAYDFSTPLTENLTLIAAFEFDQAAVNEVIAKIDAIGTVEYTEASKAKIDDAKDAYNALTDAQKALVTNVETLTAAEARYAELKAAAEQAADQAAADAVIDKIEAIGEVEYTDVCKAKIDDAKDAYNALTDAQKELVTNYETLTAAQARYAELKAAAEQTAANQAAANAVIGKINAIGSVEYTESSKAKIDDAQNAYDALTDAQKALVTNAGTLTAAQARYADLKADAEQAAANQAAADAVIAKINAIGTVEYTNVCKAKIDDAQNAYDALTDAQKALVTNAGTLTAAQARYAELKAAAEAPTNPTNPDQPSGGSGKCKWCGKDHTANFWQRIVGFWHTIFYFWAHLFGLR